MRNTLLVGLVATAFAVSSVACGDASSTSGTRARGGGYVPSPGEATDHDPDDLDTGGTDPGNPNASAPPPKPADPAGQAEQFALTLSTTTPVVDLGADVSIDVSVAQRNGFTGAVQLAAAGLPAGVTAAFTPATVTVGAAPAVAKLVLTSTVNAVPSAANTSIPLQVTGTAGSVKATANANFKVAPKLTITIPMNIDALRAANVGTQFVNQWGTAFGATPTPLKTQEGNGIVVVVKNADSTAHIVHSGGAFPHGDTARPIQPNDFEKLADGTVRTRTLSPTAAAPVNVAGYPHEGANGPSVSFRVQVQVAP